MFIKGKLFEDQPFYAKNMQMAGKGKLNDVIFLNFCHLMQNEDKVKF